MGTRSTKIIKMEEAKSNWSILENIPINEQEEIDEDVTFKTGDSETTFEKGTDRFYICHWFEETYNISIAKDFLNL